MGQPKMGESCSQDELIIGFDDAVVKCAWRMVSLHQVM